MGLSLYSELYCHTVTGNKVKIGSLFIIFDLKSQFFTETGKNIIMGLGLYLEPYCDTETGMKHKKV